MMNNISIFYLNEVFIRKRHTQERGFFPGYAIRLEIFSSVDNMG